MFQKHYVPCDIFQNPTKKLKQVFMKSNEKNKS